MQQSLTGFR